MEKKHTISVLVENEFGVLARIAGLFSSKGYNIDSLSVSETVDPTLSRMTIVTRGSDQIIEQIIKQLHKLVNVIQVEDLTKEKHVTREMGLIKVKGDRKADVLKLAEKYGARVLETTPQAMIVEITGEQEVLHKALESFEPLGVLEVVRTGLIAIQKGEQVLVGQS